MTVVRRLGTSSVALAAAALLAACSGGDGAGNAGGASTLSVSLMDAPVDGVTSVNVEIDALWIKPAGSPAVQLPMTKSPITVDLVGLTDRNAALLIDHAAIEPGTYEWLAMDVNARFDNIYDSFVTTSVGGQEELRVPSDRVRLVDGFEVAANQAVNLLFDWDLRKGLVDPPGQPGFMLKPAFRVIDVEELAELKGTVALGTLNGTGDPNGCLADGADLDVGNSVYVFAGDAVTPDDVDGADAEPIATVEAEPDAAGDYAYRTVIAPGTYTIAFTCQAGRDDPADGASDDLVFVAPVTKVVSADASVVVDF